MDIGLVLLLGLQLATNIGLLLLFVLLSAGLRAMHPTRWPNLTALFLVFLSIYLLATWSEPLLPEHVSKVDEQCSLPAWMLFAACLITGLVGLWPEIPEADWLRIGATLVFCPLFSGVVYVGANHLGLGFWALVLVPVAWTISFVTCLRDDAEDDLVVYVVGGGVFVGAVLGLVFLAVGLLIVGVVAVVGSVLLGIVKKLSKGNYPTRWQICRWGVPLIEAGLLLALWWK